MSDKKERDIEVELGRTAAETKIKLNGQEIKGVTRLFVMIDLSPKEMTVVRVGMDVLKDCVDVLGENIPARLTIRPHERANAEEDAVLGRLAVFSAKEGEGVAAADGSTTSADS